MKDIFIYKCKKDLQTIMVDKKVSCDVVLKSEEY